MLSKIKKMKVSINLTLLALTFMMLSVPCFATDDITSDTYTARSLVDAGTKTMLSNVGQNVFLTVLAIIGIVVSTGMAIWGLIFAVKKGISFFQKQASRF